MPPSEIGEADGDADQGDLPPTEAESARARLLGSLLCGDGRGAPHADRLGRFGHGHRHKRLLPYGRNAGHESAADRVSGASANRQGAPGRGYQWTVAKPLRLTAGAPMMLSDPGLKPHKTWHTRKRINKKTNESTG